MYLTMYLCHESAPKREESDSASAASHCFPRSPYKQTNKKKILGPPLRGVRNARDQWEEIASLLGEEIEARGKSKENSEK